PSALIGLPTLSALHEGGVAQALATHTSDPVQSLAATHPLPGPHAGHIPPPPQSASVSVPVFTLSAQVGSAPPRAGQRAQGQSAAWPAPWPWAEGGRSPRPQSVSPPPPFLIPSEQEALTPTPILHTPLMQSPPPPQVWPSGHLGQLPPQSTSLSLPFFTWSAQV